VSYIFDTNVVSELIKKTEKVTKRLRDVTDKGEKLFISVITDYEIRRGLFATNATTKLKIYETLRNQFEILWFDSLDLSEKAAEIYADLKQKGRLIQDNDILIAATALIKNFTVVTDDEHFMRIENLTVENWLTDSVKSLI